MTNRAELEELTLSATASPALALARVDQLDRKTLDPTVGWMADFARALALRSMLRLDDAAESYDAAIRGEVLQPADRARVLISRAGNSALAGRMNDALTDLDDAAGSGGGNASLLHQRAAVLAMCGRVHEAFDAQTKVLRLNARNPDLLLEARARQNRSKMAMIVGQPELGIRDARAAVRTFELLGHAAGAAKSEHNLAALEALNGSVSKALDLFDAAELRLADLGVATDQAAEARIDALMVGGLHREAFDHAVEVRQRHLDVGARLLAAECALMAARAASSLGERRHAKRLAEEAEREFTLQDRTGFALLARFVGQCADPSNSAQIASLGNELEAAGWSNRANHVRVLCAAWCADNGRIEDVDNLLEGLPVGRSTKSDPDVILGLALRSFRLGNHAEALALVVRGFRRVVRQARLMVGYDLRVAARWRLTSFADTGIRLALELEDLNDVWQWTERVAVLTDESAAPVVGETRELAVSLRAAEGELDRARLAGSTEAVQRLEQHVHKLERQTRKTDRTSGQGRRRHPTPLSLDAVRTRLGSHTMIKLHRCGDRVLVGIARTDEVVWRSVCAHQFETTHDRLRREVMRFQGANAASPARSDRLAAAIQRLDELVDSVVGDALTGTTGPIVIVADSPLSQFPWTMSTLLSGRQVSVAPSSTWWCRTTSRSGIRRQVAAVSGPGLSVGPGEAQSVARSWRDATLIRGRSATPARVAAAFATHDLVHLVAHGEVRADNPEFSSFALSGGRLSISALQNLPSVPTQVVLSACDGGCGASGNGKAHRSMAERLVALGVRSVIAPTFSIDDRAVSTAMNHLHQGLRSGLSGPAALAAVRQCTSLSHPDQWLAAHSFTCFGGRA